MVEFNKYLVDVHQYLLEFHGEVDIDQYLIVPPIYGGHPPISGRVCPIYGGVCPITDGVLPISGGDQLISDEIYTY